LISKEKLDVTGIEVQYYYTCKTMLWLYSHKIEPPQDNELIKEGKVIHRFKYKREKKEVELNQSKIDVLKVGDKYVVYEYKRGKPYYNHKMQLKFYIYQLKQKGVNAIGFLIGKRAREMIIINKEDIKKIKDTIKKIEEVKSLKNPPKPRWKRICKNCAYKIICFGDRYE